MIISKVVGLRGMPGVGKQKVVVSLRSKMIATATENLGVFEDYDEERF